MTVRRLLARAAVVLAFVGFAGWAMWSETGGDAVAQGIEQKPGNGAWRRAPVWDDGKAEYCAYQVSWARYASRYPGTALLVMVKEPWAPEPEVKADISRADGFDVLKLNHIRDVRTGIYAYHQMASAFVRRDSGELRKLAVMSSEACGLSTAQMTGGRLNTRSYFDGQGERTTTWPAAALPEDALPALLREYVKGTLPDRLEIFPSLMSGSFPTLEPVVLEASRRRVSDVSVPAGAFAATEIRLRGEGWDLTYAFDERGSHRLLRHTRHDGTEYRLLKCERIPYWTMHDPGGEAWLPEGFQ